MTTSSTAEALARFRRCSTAEDYFELLDVPYDQKVVDINRLHILRHFADQLVQLHRTEPESADAVLAGYRAALQRSYAAFLTSTALDHRLFKVLSDRAPEKQADFVALCDISSATSGSI